MNIVIRADAAVHIGSGHIMRCLTLADELRERGSTVQFVCRAWEGNLERYIAAKGYDCLLLPRPAEPYAEPGKLYASWLGASARQDAEETLAAIAEGATKDIAEKPIDWCITDHYGIDAEWHGILRQRARHIMVIDDIANRKHDCDVLLDQNLYDNAEERYKERVPAHSRLALGPEYALLRPEFRIARERLGDKLIRKGSIRRIMVFFGGSDPSNETAKAVKALQMLNHPDIEADIIVGVANPRREEIENICAESPNIHFHCQVPNMSDFMTHADLALGAGGSTTWERCCLGLPALTIIIAENQAEMTETATRRALQWNLGWNAHVSPSSIAEAIEKCARLPNEMELYSRNGYETVDGLGARRMASVLSEFR